MSPAKAILYCCLSFIGGIALDSFWSLSQLFMLGFLILGLIFIAVFWNKKFAIFGFYLFFLVLGCWRHQTANLIMSGSFLQETIGRKVNSEVIAVVSDNPQLKEKSQQFTVEVKDILGTKLSNNKILVIAAKYPEYRYGDKLRISGNIKEPPVFDSFNYREFLKKDGVIAVMNWPKIELLGRGFGNPVMAAIFSFKNTFQQAASRFIPPPQEGFLEALVFGDESNISKQWKDRLNLTGTRHIAAVSGMNITIISSVILAFFLSLGFWRKQAVIISLIILATYVLMIGASPSAVRAGIMAGLLIFAQLFGRLALAGRLVAFAASVMLAFNPFLIKLDIGFQLSFLAILGLVYLQPAISEKLKIIPNFNFFPLRATLASTFAAQIFTLPILLYNFGYFSLISAVSNILIVPFLAPITVLIFVFGIGSILAWPLGTVLAWPVWLSLSYVTGVIDFLSRTPITYLKMNMHWFWLALSYLCLVLLIWRMREKRQARFLIY